MRRPGVKDDRPANRRIARQTLSAGLLIAVGVLAAGCVSSSKVDSKHGVAANERAVAPGQPKGGGSYKLGKPYKVAGRWFHPQEEPGYDSVGIASWYGSDFHGQRTANGEIFDMNALSAAHPTLPMPTYARVTNLENDRSVVVRVNDRGPFSPDRLIDLSKHTAEVLGFTHKGMAEVRIQYVGTAPLDDNDGWLTTTVRQDGEPVAPVMVADAGSATTPSASVPMPPARPLADGPSPSVPVGIPETQQAFAWTSGYAETARPHRIADAFALFDSDKTALLVVAAVR